MSLNHIQKCEFKLNNLFELETYIISVNKYSNGPKLRLELYSVLGTLNSSCFNKALAGLIVGTHPFKYYEIRNLAATTTTKPYSYRF